MKEIKEYLDAVITKEELLEDIADATMGLALSVSEENYDAVAKAACVMNHLKAILAMIE